MQCFRANGSSQNTFSEIDRSNDRSSEEGNRFESGVHFVFEFADPANVGKSLLDGNKDHLFFSSKVLTYEAGTSNGISYQLCR